MRGTGVNSDSLHTVISILLAKVVGRSILFEKNRILTFLLPVLVSSSHVCSTPSVNLHSNSDDDAVGLFGVSSSCLYNWLPDYKVFCCRIYFIFSVKPLSSCLCVCLTLFPLSPRTFRCKLQSALIGLSVMKGRDLCLYCKMCPRPTGVYNSFFNHVKH